MRLRQRRSLSLYEPEVEYQESAEQLGAAQQAAKVHHRLYFHVKRPQEFGGNRHGHCTGIQLHRSGMLIIHGDGDSTRTHLAHGTWFDLVTEPPRGEA